MDKLSSELIRPSDSFLEIQFDSAGIALDLEELSSFLSILLTVNAMSNCILEKMEDDYENYLDVMGSVIYEYAVLADDVNRYEHSVDLKRIVLFDIPPPISSLREHVYTLNILSLTYSNPLKIKIKPNGTMKAFVIAVMICGGEVNLKEGSAKIPGLIDGIGRITKLIYELSDERASSPSAEELSVLQDKAEDLSMKIRENKHIGLEQIKGIEYQEPL